MKKWGFPALLFILLANAASVGAESANPTVAPSVPEARADEAYRPVLVLPGSVTAGRVEAVTAPYGGPAETILVRPGDFVSAQTALLTLGTGKLYAPVDGTLRGNAQPGDDMAFLQTYYGAALYLEPRAHFLIKTDTQGAYQKSESLALHIGEPVYISSRTAAGLVGAGRILAVAGEKYTVEITKGNFAPGENVTIFRDAGFYAPSRIGMGKAEANPPIPLNGTGTVFALHAAPGERVARGELLLETVAGQSAYAPEATTAVKAPCAAVVASVEVGPGAIVAQGQVLFTLYPTDGFEISIPVWESDLSEIRIGDTVRMEWANLPDATPFFGKVRKVSGLGTANGDDPTIKYVVTVAASLPELARPGLSVNAYFNERSEK